MRSELKTISGKLDALAVSIQQTKDKGKLPDLKKQNATETVNWRLGKMYFFEDTGSPGHSQPFIVFVVVVD